MRLSIGHNPCQSCAVFSRSLPRQKGEAASLMALLSETRLRERTEQKAAVGGGSQASGTHGLDLDPVPAGGVKGEELRR